MNPAALVTVIERIENLTAEIDGLKNEVENDSVIKRTVEKIITMDRKIRAGTAEYDKSLTRFLVKKIVVYSDRTIDVIFAEDITITEVVAKR